MELRRTYVHRITATYGRGECAMSDSDCIYTGESHKTQSQPVSTHSVVNQANILGSLSATKEKIVSHTGNRLVKYSAPFS